MNLPFYNIKIFFSDPTSNLESLAAIPELLKELIQQMNWPPQFLLQREQGFNKLLQDADKNIFTNNVHI